MFDDTHTTMAVISTPSGEWETGVIRRAVKASTGNYYYLIRL